MISSEAEVKLILYNLFDVDRLCLGGESKSMLRSLNISPIYLYSSYPAAKHEPECSGRMNLSNNEQVEGRWDTRGTLTTDNN